MAHPAVLLVAAGLAAALVVLTTPLVRMLARWTGVLAYPKEDRWHTTPIPMLGGVAIFLGVVGSVLVTQGSGTRVLSLLVPGAGFFLLGVLDDFVKLKPSTKLTGQIAVGCVAVMIGAPPNWTPWEALNLLLGILWIVTITNAFNLLDNMDGLCAGVAGIAAFACAMDLLVAAPILSGYAAALAGAAAGFLLFNFKPASIFMGDGGSLFLGGTLAVLSLIERDAGTGLVSAMAVPVFILLIPLFDTSFVTLSRLLSTRPASQGGRDHTSHRLVAMGFSERQAVLLLWLLAAAGAAAGLLGRHSSLLEAVLLGPLLLVGLALLGIQLARVRVYDGEDFSLLIGKAYTPLLVDVTYKRRIFEILLDVFLVTFSYYAAYVIRFDRDMQIYTKLFADSLPIVIACQVLSFFVTGVYRGTWRYLSLADLTTYAKAVALGVLSSVMVIVYMYRFEGFSRSVFVIDGLVLGLLLVGSRLSFRIIGDAAGRRRPGHRVLIYGAGDGGALLLRELRNNTRYNFQPVGFIDDDPARQRHSMLRLPILGGFEQLERAVAERQPHAIILSTAKLPPDRLASLKRLCYASGTPLLQLRFSLEDVPLEELRVER